MPRKSHTNLPITLKSTKFLKFYLEIDWVDLGQLL